MPTDHARTGDDAVARQVDASLNALRQGTDVDRTIFFSDAVFAIAMTLLVLELRIPDLGGNVRADEFAQAAAEKIPAFIAFLLSFALIGITWLTHHRRFKAVTAYDTRLQVLNLGLLFFVAFLPVPTGMLFQHSGNSPIPPMLYAATIAGMFGMLDLTWWHTHRAGFLAPTVSPALYRFAAAALRPALIVFALSIPLALVSPSAAEYSWLALLPLAAVHGRWQKRRLVRAERARLRAD